MQPHQIKRALRDHDYTLTKLGEELGINCKTISAIVNGRVKSNPTFVAISNITGIPVSHLKLQPELAPDSIRFTFRTMEPGSECGQRLIEERQRLDLDRFGLARLMDKSVAQLRHWESGNACPGFANLRVLYAIGFDVLYILTGHRQQPASNSIPPIEETLG